MGFCWAIWAAAGSRGAAVSHWAAVSYRAAAGLRGAAVSHWAAAGSSGGGRLAGWAGGAPDDQVRGQHYFAVLGAGAVEAFHEQRDGVLGELA
ncbi:MAG TPA: hypothetical protein VGH99_20775, partial [Pseudonocardia sp.]